MELKADTIVMLASLAGTALFHFFSLKYSVHVLRKRIDKVEKKVNDVLLKHIESINNMLLDHESRLDILEQEMNVFKAIAKKLPQTNVPSPQAKTPRQRAIEKHEQDKKGGV